MEQNKNFQKFIDSKDFILKDGIAKKKSRLSFSQKQTKDTFSYLWNKQTLFDKKDFNNNQIRWLKSLYNFDQKFLKKITKNKDVLDAGCGAGQTSYLLFNKMLNESKYIGLDVSESVYVAKDIFKKKKIYGNFVQCSLLDIPKSVYFDTIISQGVLHHTDSTSKSIAKLSKHLKKGGYFLFYVYKKKSAMREFSDDYIRNYLKDCESKKAWELLKPLTKLGKQLGELNIDLNIKDDIKVLGIPKGKINLQRLIYYYFFKCYYKENLSLEQMNLINYDWFTPKNCHRHTHLEIRTILKKLKLKIIKMNEDQSGLSYVTQK